MKFDGVRRDLSHHIDAVAVKDLVGEGALLCGCCGRGCHLNLLGPLPLKALGTHHAKRCEGPASHGKRVHFREGRKNVLRSVQKIVLERPETREGG